MASNSNRTPLVIAVGPSSFAEEDATPLQMLKEAGVTIIPNPYGRRLSEDETMALLQSADGLLAGLEPLTRRVLVSAPRLKAVARVGIGMDNVDLAVTRELGIKVSNTPDGPTDAVAEMTVAAMLALVRQLVPSNELLHAGTWKKAIGNGLVGTKILLVGFGRIGRRVAELLAPFKAEILACDPMLPNGTLPNGVQRVTLDHGLRVAEVISLHAAGTARLLGSDEFRVMRDGVILLNSARGSLVDEPALIAALDSGKVRAAWMDVFPEEPYKGPLTRYAQVLLTPHISTYTRQCRRDMETQAVANLIKDLQSTGGTRH